MSRVESIPSMSSTPKTARTKIRRTGNSAKVTIARPVLEASGLNLDEEVVVTAQEGSIEVRKADSAYTRCLEIYEGIERRYGRALDRLAR